MGSPLGVNLDLQNVIAGGDAFLAGKAAHISGITAKGQTLSFTLAKPNADLRRRSSRCSGSLRSSRTCRTRASGLNTYPAAGPYYIKSRDPGRSTVLTRNPYYKGDRPANPDQIVFTPNVNIDQSLLQVKAGQADLDLGQIPPTAAADLAKQYGINKGRFFVGSTSCVDYMAHEHRPCAVRQREPAEGRQLGDRPSGPGSPARRVRRHAHDQILVPGIPGYKPFNAYALKGANVAKAKQVGGAAIASAPTLNVVHTTSPYSTNRAQVAEFNLKQAGFKVNDVPTPATNYYQVIQTKGTTYNFVTNGGWCADYFDPFDYLNVLFDGRKFQAANNNNYAYFNNASFNKGLDHAAALSGSARAAAYAKLDQRPDGQLRAGRAVPGHDEPVLRRLAREELDLQLVLRRAVPQRSGGRLAVRCSTGSTPGEAPSGASPGAAGLSSRRREKNTT